MCVLRERARALARVRTRAGIREGSICPEAQNRQNLRLEEYRTEYRTGSVGSISFKSCDNNSTHGPPHPAGRGQV